MDIVWYRDQAMMALSEVGFCDWLLLSAQVLHWDRRNCMRRPVLASWRSCDMSEGEMVSGKAKARSAALKQDIS